MRWRRANDLNNLSKNAAQIKNWRKNNPEKHKKLLSEYRVRNKQRLAEYYKEWRFANSATYNSYQKTRKKRVKQSTPRWADLNAIREFYFNCPPGFHVDHIIPITGQNVSGLHVRENLQYLPALENLKKGNRHS